MNFFFGFSGRIGRSAWWLGQLGILVFWLLAIPVYGALILSFDFSSEHAPGQLSDGAWSLLFALLVGFSISFWMNLALTVRRLHDRGKSGWWYCITFVPFGFIWLIIQCGFLAGAIGHHDGRSPDRAGEIDIDAHIARIKAEKAQFQPIRTEIPVMRPAPVRVGAARPSFGRRGL